MISTRNLTKKFGNTTAVDNVTFHVNRGEVFGLLGPNGAGKTTTIRMICCLISRTEGDAQVDGLDISKKEDAIRIRKSIGLVPDNVGLYETFSAYQNLLYFGRLYEFPEERIKENIEKYLRILDLWQQKDQHVSTYSKGMKQKVAIARSLVHDPELLVMDEPTANLDPEAAKTIRDIILDLKKDGRTILLNTHNLDEAQRICSRIGVLRTSLLATGSPDDLERAIRGRKTVIQLERVSDQILAAAKSVNPVDIEIDGNRLILELKDPEGDTPTLVSAVTAAGGKIRSVKETGASLEDVYLNLVRER